MYGEVYHLIAGTFGDEQATALCRKFGGVTMYIPAAARSDHPIAAHVSLDALDLLVRHYGGSVIYIPIGPDGGAAQRRALVMTALHEGCSANVAARRGGVSVATVRRIKRSTRAKALDRR